MSNDIVSTQLSVLAKNLDMQNVSQDQIKQTLTSTVFKGANDVQLVTLMIVANQYKLNPFTKEIFAFPAKGGGITPVVSVDGWARIINDNPLCDGIQFEQDGESCTCKIFRKDRTHPTVVTEYLEECAGTSEPWKKYPKRMLRHKALIQCARVAFGFSGIYDEDEAKRIDGTHQQATIAEPLDTAYQAFCDEKYDSLKQSANLGTKNLETAYLFLKGQDINQQYIANFWKTYGAGLKEIAQQADQNAQIPEFVEAEYEHIPA